MQEGLREKRQIPDGDEEKKRSQAEKILMHGNSSQHTIRTHLKKSQTSDPSLNSRANDYAAAREAREGRPTGVTRTGMCVGERPYVHLCFVVIRARHLCSVPSPPAPIYSRDAKNIGRAVLYFSLSTAVTWWFIEAGAGLYASREKMMLSCAIAGGKWALQISAAFFLLGEKRWVFIWRLGEVCAGGSLVLVPYCFAAVQPWMGSTGFFLLLLAAVALMIMLYCRAVRRTGLNAHWLWGWIFCLAIAITLQITIVAE